MPTSEEVWENHAIRVVWKWIAISDWLLPTSRPTIGESCTAQSRATRISAYRAPNLLFSDSCWDDAVVSDIGDLSQREGGSHFVGALVASFDVQTGSAGRRGRRSDRPAPRQPQAGLSGGRRERGQLGGLPQLSALRRAMAPRYRALSLT